MDCIHLLRGLFCPVESTKHHDMASDKRSQPWNFSLFLFCFVLTCTTNVNPVWRTHSESEPAGIVFLYIKSPVLLEGSSRSKEMTGCDGSRNVWAGFCKDRPQHVPPLGLVGFGEGSEAVFSEHLTARYTHARASATCVFFLSGNQGRGNSTFREVI